MTKAVKAWKNANVITVNDEMPRAEALAVDAAGRILYTGSSEGLEAYLSEQTELIDAGGNTILPGFIEGHSHPFDYGNLLRSIQVRDVSKELILERVAEAVKHTPKGQWIIAGMGFNNDVWEDPSYPSKEDLDAVAPDNPVLIPRMDGHLMWFNSKAFEVAGVTADTADPEGGEFFRNPDGSLQGCAVDAAGTLVKSYMPPKTVEDYKEDILTAQAAFLSMGITSITDMSSTLMQQQAIRELLEEGRFKLRYYGCAFDFAGKNGSEETHAFLKAGPRIGLFDDHYTVRCCKFLGDGAVGAQSAFLKEPYADRPGHRGIGMYTDEELYEGFREAADHGFQITIHAIGDATIEQVLKTYERLQKERDYGDHRWRIEHFQTVTGDTPEQAAALGIIPGMQPLHAPNSASMALRRLGAGRLQGAYAAGLVLRSTGLIALGSDAPVATPKPLSEMHAAITRTNDRLEPQGGFCMENALTPEEALLGYTRWGAYAQFAEERRGCLKPGMQADFVILDRDPVRIGHEKPDELLDISVMATFICGQEMYRG